MTNMDKHFPKTQKEAITFKGLEPLCCWWYAVGFILMRAGPWAQVPMSLSVGSCNTIHGE